MIARSTSAQGAPRRADDSSRGGGEPIGGPGGGAYVTDRDPAMWVVWVAIAVSLLVWPFALGLGFNEPVGRVAPNYTPYFKLHNWWPYPFFLLGLAPALWLTWRPMLRAWVDLARSGVLRAASGRPNAAGIDAVVAALCRWRWVAVAAALAVTLAINIVDRAELAGLYNDAPLQTQRSYACNWPEPFVLWILQHTDDGFACSDTPYADPAAGGPKADPSAAWNGPHVAPNFAQVAFFILTTLQQLVIVFLAALAIAQLLLHSALFALFERLPAARQYGLRLALNCRSPVNEFGLERWNHALNNFYWAVSPALLGVFLSRAATPEAEYLPGQAMLGVAVPLCLLAPMAATIVARQLRLPDAWSTLEPDGEVPAEDYRRQQLWPLDRNWSSKLGIVLAFALAALSIGFELGELISL